MPCPGRWQSLFERRKFVLRAILTLNLVIDHVDAKVVMIAPFVVVGINGVAERLTQACLGFELLLMLERGQSGSFAVGDVTFLSIELGQLFYRSLAGGIGFSLGFVAFGGECGGLLIRRGLGLLKAVLFRSGFARRLVSLLSFSIKRGLFRAQLG